MEENHIQNEIKNDTSVVNSSGEGLGESGQKRKKKKSHFGLGFVLGLLTCFLVFVILVLVLCIKGMVFLSAGKGLVDSEVTSKAETIRAYLDQYSIYDFTDEELKKGMLNGLLKGTGDKYAQYYTPEEIQALTRDYNGTIYGIGALIKQDESGAVFISGVYEDSPAEKAGIIAGDVIVAVDGESVEGLDRYDVVDKIRGDLGTKVVVTVNRDGKELEFTMNRGKIKKIDVEYKMATDTIGYIYIKDFDDVTTDQFADALATLKGQGMEDMILDLRSNTGGLLRVCVDIAQQLMPKGTIVSIENVGGKVKEYTCDGSREFSGRIVILTDGYTASASEILTGALRDSGKAISLGITTYGKGLVQDFYYLSDGSAIKFTTNQYFTPKGTAINEIGIEPDIELSFDYEAYLENETDNQIEAAIEYLEK